MVHKAPLMGNPKERRHCRDGRWTNEVERENVTKQILQNVSDRKYWQNVEEQKEIGRIAQKSTAHR